MAISLAAMALDGASGLWPLVGALAGFLIWNWAPAKVFMGDVGSTFVGAVFAGMVLQATSWPQALPCSFWQLHCWPMRAFALFAGQPLANESFRLTDCTCFSDCIKPGGPIKKLLGCTQAPPPFWLSCSMARDWRVLVGAVAVISAGLWLDQKEAVPFA